MIWVYTGTVPIMGDIESDMDLYWNCTHNGEILGLIWVYTRTVPIMGRS